MTTARTTTRPASTYNWSDHDAGPLRRRAQGDELERPLRHHDDPVDATNAPPTPFIDGPVERGHVGGGRLDPVFGPRHGRRGRLPRRIEALVGPRPPPLPLGLPRPLRRGGDGVERDVHGARPRVSGEARDPPDRDGLPGSQRHDARGAAQPKTRTVSVTSTPVRRARSTSAASTVTCAGQHDRHPEQRGVVTAPLDPGHRRHALPVLAAGPTARRGCGRSSRRRTCRSRPRTSPTSPTPCASATGRPAPAPGSPTRRAATATSTGSGSRSRRATGWSSPRGDLPVDARLDLYCVVQHAPGDGRRERRHPVRGADPRSCPRGTYRVKVSFPGGGRSDNPYVVQFRAMSSGCRSRAGARRAGSGGGAVRIVGEVLNNSGATVGRPTVKATFRNAGGTRRRDADARTVFAARLGDGGVTPFALAGTVPTYASVSFAVTTGSLPTAAIARSDVADPHDERRRHGDRARDGAQRRLDDGTQRRRGAHLVRQAGRGPRPRQRLRVAVDARRRARVGTFTIVRPVLVSVQGTRTALRAS